MWNTKKNIQKVTETGACLCFQSMKQAKIKFSDFISNPYAFNLAISHLCEMQSQAFDRSVNTAAKTPLLSQFFGSLSIITKRQYCVPNPFPKPH